MKAGLFKLNLRDFLKGAIVAVITAVITFLIDALQTGASIDIELLKRVGITSAIAFLSYLLKNLFTNSEDKFATPEGK